ncbi:UNVERIFIED_CONTAM: hypothetical protein NCL1_39415 [Trichonephila clavipes]
MVLAHLSSFSSSILVFSLEDDFAVTTSSASPSDDSSDSISEGKVVKYFQSFWNGQSLCWHLKKITRNYTKKYLKHLTTNIKKYKKMLD